MYKNCTILWTITAKNASPVEDILLEDFLHLTGLKHHCGSVWSPYRDMVMGKQWDGRKKYISMPLCSPAKLQCKCFAREQTIWADANVKQVNANVFWADANVLWANANVLSEH